MQNWPIESKIRYEGDLDPGFAEGIASIPGFNYWANCPALTVPLKRIIMKVESTINQKGSA